MPARTRGRWRQSVRLIGIALYALFLVTSPFEHHDLACELRTPRHCTACASTLLGSDPVDTTPLACAPLADAGRADATPPVAHGVLLTAHTSGRSPPVDSLKS
ncbi:MAG: hypothetical protein IT176_01425 [Acidobacteria bacterium]|nr:hypothetical protein [Acidobacteriota bacterium]